jgi:hypothetical protein
MNRPERPRASALALFAHPLPLLALVVLVVNDHLAKGAGVLPETVTGKASDVAGLFVFPLVLTCLARWFFPRVSPVTSAAVGATLSSLVFAAMKTVPSVNACACALLGPTALDPSDLFALPSCAAAVLFVKHAVRAERRSPARSGLSMGLHRFAVVIAAIASMATSQQRLPQSAPPPEARATSECARVVIHEDSLHEGLDSVTATVSAAETCSVDLVAELRTEQGPEARATVTSDPQHLELSAGSSREVVFDLRLPLPTTCDTPRTLRISPRGRAPLASGPLRCKLPLPLAVPGEP